MTTQAYQTEYDEMSERLQAADVPAYTWHSGGGIWLIRLDLPDGRHVLVDIDDDEAGSEAWRVGTYTETQDLLRMARYRDEEAMLGHMRGAWQAAQLAKPRPTDRVMGEEPGLDAVLDYVNNQDGVLDYTITYEQSRECLDKCGPYTIDPMDDAGYVAGDQRPSLGEVLTNLADAWYTQGPDDQLHYPLGVTIKWRPGTLGGGIDQQRIDTYVFAPHSPDPVRRFRWHNTVFPPVPIEQNIDVIAHMKHGHTCVVWYPIDTKGTLRFDPFGPENALDISDTESGEAGATTELRCQTCDVTLPLDKQIVDVP